MGCVTTLVQRQCWYVGVFLRRNYIHANCGAQTKVIEGHHPHNGKSRSRAGFHTPRRKAWMPGRTNVGTTEPPTATYAATAHGHAGSLAQGLGRSAHLRRTLFYGSCAAWPQ